MKRFVLGFLVCGLLTAAVLAVLSQADLVHWSFHFGHGESGDSARRYHCPMHPNYVSDRQGDCPICGMRLVPIEDDPAAGATGAPGHDVHAGPQEYTCPMHPEVVSDQPGTCPLCGMRLEPVPSTAAGTEHDRAQPAVNAGTSVDGYVPVTISAERRQLMGITVAEVERAAIERTLRTYGRIAVDETRVSHVHTKFDGYVEELFVAYEGRMVRKGEPLFTIYSPELYSTQQEYLLALRAREASTGREESDRLWTDRMLEAARRRLSLWDIADEEIAELRRTGQPRRTLTIFAPVTGIVARKQVIQGLQVSPADELYEIVDLSSVWVLGEVYETDLAFVRLGQSARIELRARPGQPLQGRVSYIDPQVDPRTRTVKVRLDVPNPSGMLKPEMYAEVIFRGSLGEALTVPENALVMTGERSLVFVDAGGGTYVPREVVTGQRTEDDRIAVLSGLQAGEKVVTAANFLLDSESRLKAALARSSHQH